MPAITLSITNNSDTNLSISNIESSVVLRLTPGETREFVLDEVAYGEIIQEVETASLEVLADTVTNRITYTTEDPRNPGQTDLSNYDLASNIVLRDSVNPPVEYDTLQAAINAATAGDEIVLGSKEIRENITIDKQLTIGTRDGIPGSASITGPDGTGATVDITSKCELVNVVIKTPTGAVGVTTSHSSGIVNFRTCFFEPQGTGGTCLEHTGNGITRILADSVVRFNQCLHAFDLNGAGRLALLDTNAALMSACSAYVMVRSGSLRMTSSGCNSTQFMTFDYGVRIVGASTVVVQLCDFSGSTLSGLCVESDDVDIDISDSDLRSDSLDIDVDDALDGTDAILRVTNSRASRDNMHLGQGFLQGAEVSLQLNTDRASGDRVLALHTELGVGFPEKGFESNFGEGDSYTRGMLVYTATSGGTFADVSVAARSSDDSTFTFSDNAVDSAIYVASSLLSTATGDSLMFHGIKYDCVTAGTPGSGRIAIEYWNGTAWAEVEGMVTTDGYPHLPKADKYFEEEGPTHLRHRQRMNLSWVRNDPTSVGTNYFWMRYRVVDATYTTVPVFERFKLHGNFASIGEDGFREYYGACRVIKRLSVDISDIQASNNSPANQDIYFGDKLSAGRIENAFDANNVDRIGFATYLPYEIDTSNGLRFIWSVVSQLGDAVNESEWVVRYDVFVDGDSAFPTPATAPDSSPTQRQVTYTGVMPATANTITTFSVFIDIRDLVARTGALQDPPIFAFSLERNPVDPNDTFNDSIDIVTFGAFYAAWCDGASLTIA